MLQGYTTKGDFDLFEVLDSSVLQQGLPSKALAQAQKLLQQKV